MNEFLGFEAESKHECYIVLRRPSIGGARDIARLSVPLETLREIALYPEQFIDRVQSFISLVDAGII